MYVDILILAHLAQRPYHGYELKRDVERVLGDSFSINNNHLYPALRRFEEMGAITREVERQPGRPDRHIYQITDRGNEVLQDLLRDFPLTLARDENEFQTRVAFFHLLDPEGRRAILVTRQEALRQKLMHLEWSRSQVSSDHSEFFYVTRLLTFQEQQIQQELDWIAELMQEVNA